MIRAIRPIRIEGDVAYVTLTKGYEAIIDAADVPLVREWNWYASGGRPGKGGPYAARTAHDKGTGRQVIMHREIVGASKDLEVDHVDGNTLNNMRSNLREATRAQNARNTGTPKNNTSGIKGVRFVARYNKWTAKIKVNSLPIHLGTYDTAGEAAAAYAAASKILHGEFGRTN